MKGTLWKKLDNRSGQDGPCRRLCADSGAIPGSHPALSLRLTGDSELSRDLAQDTFLQAYQGILKTDSELSFKAWLYRIATNNALQHFRRKKLIFFLPFSRMKGEDEIPAGDCAKETEESLAIQDALRKSRKIRGRAWCCTWWKVSNTGRSGRP